MKRLALALLLGACRTPADITQDFAPFDPPAVYQAWWYDMQWCSGARADFSRVRWWLVEPDAGPYFTWNGTRVTGLWYDSGDIFISRPLAYDRVAVSHEMVHQLLGTPDHPAQFTLCGVRVTAQATSQEPR